MRRNNQKLLESRRKAIRRLLEIGIDNAKEKHLIYRTLLGCALDRTKVDDVVEIFKSEDVQNCGSIDAKVDYIVNSIIRKGMKKQNQELKFEDESEEKKSRNNVEIIKEIMVLFNELIDNMYNEK